MRPEAALLLALLLAACGGAGDPSVHTADRAGRSNLIDTPAIARLTEDQLHGLAGRCQRYPASGPARGPYSAKYCDEALAAWSDSPIHMLIIPPQNAKATQAR